MTENQFITIRQDIKDQVAESIEKNVNGKIRNMDKKIDDYIKADEEWKTSVTPPINIMRNAVVFTNTLLWIFKVIGLVGGASGAVYGIIKLVQYLN